MDWPGYLLTFSDTYFDLRLKDNPADHVMTLDSKGRLISERDHLAAKVLPDDQLTFQYGLDDADVWQLGMESMISYTVKDFAFRN